MATSNIILLTIEEAVSNGSTRSVGLVVDASVGFTVRRQLLVVDL